MNPDRSDDAKGRIRISFGTLRHEPWDILHRMTSGAKHVRHHHNVASTTSDHTADRIVDRGCAKLHVRRFHDHILSLARGQISLKLRADFTDKLVGLILPTPVID